jgi:hypothetical protein
MLLQHFHIDQHNNGNTYMYPSFSFCLNIIKLITKNIGYIGW